MESRNHDKQQFFSLDDYRLDWLENYFLSYLHTTKCASSTRQKDFLTNETYEAITLTTKSTVLCIKYLLENGYHYVLTRAFSSNPVESIFSTLRRMSGSNDMLDARAVNFSLQKILKTGILSMSNFSSVENHASDMTDGRPIQEVDMPDTAAAPYSIPESVLNILQQLLNQSGKL